MGPVVTPPESKATGAISGLVKKDRAKTAIYPTIDQASYVVEDEVMDVEAEIMNLEAEMLTAAENLEFEKAAALRDRIKELKGNK